MDPSGVFQSNLLVAGSPFNAVMQFPPSYCDDPSFRIYFLPCEVILRASEIPRHEDVFAELVSHTAAELKANKMGKRSIFISHRWVAGKPDSDDHAQLDHIKQTIQLFENYEQMFVWIDYSCMKQDSPDLPTIQRLNYILSYCDFFMIVLPAHDPRGLEYIRRVWCIYEWISVLHFKKILILPNSDLSTDLLRHTLDVLLEIILPDVLPFLETARLNTNSQVDLLANYLSMIQLEQPLFVKDDFISKLQAFDERDKEYVYDNLSSYFSLIDLLYVYLAGGSIFSLEIISVKDVPKGSIALQAVRDYLESTRRGSRSSSSLSSLNLDELLSSDEEGT